MSNRFLSRVAFYLFIVIVFVLIFKNHKTTNNKPNIPVPAPTFESALESINKEDITNNINFLASDNLEGRMSGKKGNVAAAEFLLREFEKYGLKTKLHAFKINKTNNGPNNEVGDDFTQNVYGWIEGSSLKDEIVVVGAHFDHIGYGPKYSRSKSIAIHNGADDNASGTVAVLEVAKAMSKLKPARTVIFQLYSAEEMGLLGSRFYCDHPVLPENAPDIKKHVAMINLDMVGHLNLQYQQVAFLNSGLDIMESINELTQKYKFAKKIAGNGGGSDHVSFYNKKIPVAFIHTGTHKYYHTPEDDVDTLNLDGLVEVSKYAFELCWNLSNKNKPEFNNASFRELPYTHDHDSEIIFNPSPSSPTRIFRR